MPPVTDTSLPRFAERVTEATCGAARVLLLPTPVDRVVTFRGSFETRPDFGAGEDLVQELTSKMLDRGTRQRDRFAVAEALENRGAQLRFTTDGLRCQVYGRMLRDDVGDVLALLAEQLREPLFDPDEFEKARMQRAAELQRSLDSTGAQASGAALRRIYDANHPNYYPDPKAELDALAALTVDEVRAYHEAHFGARDLILAFAGDFDPEAVTDAVSGKLGDWSRPSEEASFATSATPSPPGRVDIPISDRQNLDVRMLQPVAVRRTDADYLPLYVGNHVLGGNFSARLMSTIRDEQGLTYGIGSSMSGFKAEHDGYWRIAVTLSGDSLERGIEATLAEVRRFVEDGITAEELAEKQTTIEGAFKVGLATTGGLTASLLVNVERGFGVDYLDRYPGLIGALTLDEVNAAVRRHFDPEALHIGVAGTFPSAHDSEGANPDR